MRFIKQDELVSRDLGNHPTWLLILKQNLRVTRGHPHAQSGLTGAAPGAPASGTFQSSGPRAVATIREVGFPRGPK
jgi:hypothetical protein